MSCSDEHFVNDNRRFRLRKCRSGIFDDASGSTGTDESDEIESKSLTCTDSGLTGFISSIIKSEFVEVLLRYGFAVEVYF